MKKILCIILTVLLLILSGCSKSNEVCSNDLYGIYEVDGEFILRFHNEDINVSNPNHSGTLKAPDITFPSVSSMKKAILNADFSTDALDAIIRKARADDGDVVICNLNKLYDAVLPEGEKLARVRWFIDSYSFSMHTLSGSLSLATESDVKDFADLYGFDPNNPNVTIESKSTEEARNATVYEYKLNNYNEEWKCVIYTQSTKDKTITVVEQYNYGTSKTVPETICFWGNCGDAFFTGKLTGFTERPSYEWVTSFGLKPYVETETE